MLKKRKSCLLIIAIAVWTNSFAQSWGNWISVGNGIEISFKFGRTPCAFANTYARLRNTSGNKYCFVIVSFTTFCDNETQKLSINANNLLPGAVLESRGDFYSTSLQVSNITITKLEDANCKTIINRNIKIQPENNTRNGSSINNIPTIPDKNGGYGIYQNDNVVNPKPQIDYAQKQKQEDAATDNAMKSWRSADSARNDELRRLNSIPKKYKATSASQQNKQQEDLIQRQKQIAAQQQEKLNQLQQRIEEQQRRYQQTQLDFANAQTAADNAYQAAITNGKKESGAMVDATLAASQQFSDPNAQLATLGVGLAASLFMHWGKKKQERLEKEAALKREEERKQAIINAKGKYVADALNINKYGFADLVSKQRYAALLLTPKQNTPDEQSIYFTIPVLVPKYADDTYPLKDEIEKKLLKSISLDKTQLTNMKVYTLYPITDVEKFQDEFTKKMGSGHLIYLPAELIEFSGYPFNSNTETEGTDFWGNPVKKENKPATNKNKPTKNDFWNN